MAWEKFENVEDQTWTLAGNASSWSYTTGLQGSSNYSRQFVLEAGGEKYITNILGAGNKIYHAGWFKISLDSMLDGSTERFVQIGSTTDMYLCISLELVKTGSQLQVRPVYYDNGVVVGDAVNISANVAYHYGLVYDHSGSDNYAWYLSTTTSLGIAQSSGSITTSRSPGAIRIGDLIHTGTPGLASTTILFDSFDINFVSLVYDAETSIANFLRYIGKQIIIFG